MDKKTKALLWSLVAVIVILVAFKYFEFYINKDYTFITQVDCDPATESCFQIICEEEGCDDSSGIIYYDGSPYKYVEMPASLAPMCLEDTTCPEFTCDQVGEGCETYYCSEENIEDPEFEACIS